MLMLMLMLMLVFMFMFMFMLMFILVVVLVLKFLDPGCRGGYLFEIEQVCVDQVIEGNVTEIAFDDFGRGLDCLDHGMNLVGVPAADFGYFVEQDDVAELYLLDHQILDVLLVDIVAGQCIAAFELVAETEGIDYSRDAVQIDVLACLELAAHLRQCTDGLGYRFGFADAAGLDHDVIELARFGEVA